MVKAVFDTNVYISAFVFPHTKAEEAYLLAVRGKVKLFTSVAILTELANKLRGKFAWEDREITEALRHISNVAHVIKPDVKIDVLQDKADNRVLECAAASEADIIVTGDKHLLGLKEYKGIGIIRLADFLYTFNRQN